MVKCANSLPSSSKHVFSGATISLLNIAFVDVDLAGLGTVKPASLNVFLMVISVTDFQEHAIQQTASNAIIATASVE